MAKISQYFKDRAKTIKDYPKTLIKAVYGDDGKRLDNIISDITSDIDSTKAKIGTTDISKYGDGTVTGAIKSACDKANVNEVAIADVNSNLEKLVIISQSIELENNVSSFTLIKSGFSKPPKTMYVLLDAIEPNKSGAYFKLYLNNQGDLYTTKEPMIPGTWYINGAYISL